MTTEPLNLREEPRGDPAPGEGRTAPRRPASAGTAVTGRRVFEILVHPEKCAGCLTCQLVCSLRFTKTASPARAAIVIQRPRVAALGSQISFTAECDECAICARRCPYEALTLRRRSEVRRHGSG